ncbi:HNH endonuclease [Kitasatospora sp. NPDC048296]|uniref:HNH endonuclease n=1 Tax=Kitasatospora sp. NPDC048296 TaxID=3364048 RepID=UPI003717D453
MSAGRPAVPRELRRDLLVEAGHRCAIPTCRAVPLELAHIVPWAKVRVHEFSNMIALCPNCHTRFDQGQIDRLAMRKYKAGLQSSADRVGLLDAYRCFQAAIDRWSASVADPRWDDITFDKPTLRAALVTQCGLDCGRAQGALDSLTQVAAEEASWEAKMLYGWVKSWADDVADGLWPSTHPGATEHDPCDLAEIEYALHRAICVQLGLEMEVLPLRVDVKGGGSPVHIGGTGKAY